MQNKQKWKISSEYKSGIISGIVSGLAVALIIIFLLEPYRDNNLSIEANKKKLESRDSDLKEADNIIDKANKSGNAEYSEAAYKKAIKLLGYLLD